MRIWRAVTVGAALAALLLSSACGGSDDTAPSSPAGVHERMKTVLRKANTGSFQQRTVVVRGAGSVTTTENGTFDLAGKAWAIRLRYTSQPPDLVQQLPRRQRLGADIVTADSHVYLSMPSWPTRLKGRWAETDPAKTSGSSQPTLPTRSFFPAALSSLQPVSVAHRDGGWTLRGRVGADVSMEALGLDRELSPRTVEQLTGTGEVVVDLGPDYAPTQVRLDGNTVSVKAGLPEALAKDMAFMRTTTVLTDLGRGRAVTVPRDLIAPDQVPRTR